MNRTGVCPREIIGRKGLGLAMAGLVFGLAASALAKDHDPYLPRTEEVMDADGSVWKVLIVPGPSSLPAVPHHAALQESELPPAPSEEAVPQTYEKAPKDDAAAEDKAEAAPAQDEDKTYEEAPKDDAAAEDKPEAAPVQDEDKKVAKDPSDNPFGVEIVPRFSYPVLPPSAACLPADEEGKVQVSPWDYAWVYHSIPFVRSEYIANPSYRHEAAMEMVFGQLRPTVVHKHPGQPRPHATQFPFENDIIRPYSYYSLGPGGGYGRGPLPFAAPGAYGVNYNFYWPMPTVYRQY